MLVSTFFNISLQTLKTNVAYRFLTNTKNAQKRLFVPSFARIGTGVALRLIFATWCVVKGRVGKLRSLPYSAVAVEQTAEE